MYKTNLTFCASYEYETYPCLKSHNYKGLLSDKRETTQQWRNHFIERKDSTIWSCATCATYITVIPQWLSFVPGYFLQVGFGSLFQFSSFSVAMDINVNKPLCLESVKSAVSWITWWNSLGLLPQFLRTASDQKLEVYKAWEWRY